MAAAFCSDDTDSVSFEDLVSFEGCDSLTASSLLRFAIFGVVLSREMIKKVVCWLTTEHQTVGNFFFSARHSRLSTSGERSSDALVLALSPQASTTPQEDPKNLITIASTTSKLDYQGHINAQS